MKIVELVNTITAILFFAGYAYQFVYLAVAVLCRPRHSGEAPPHRFAILICARNEEGVVGQLIGSIKAQRYPGELLDVFLIADNCTDRTAAAAREAGATVWERHDTAHIGKGYALDALLHRMAEAGYTDYDGYLVFDADNILAPDFMANINRTFSRGFDIVTGYRNSKNFGDNWISAGYGLCFLRDARLLNYPRARLGLSAVVTGTGFLFSRRILDSQGGGWPYHLLSEDTQFSIDHILAGQRIGMAYDAVFYDEQPTSLRQSWHQRIRWTRGSLQVLRQYGGRLLRGALRGSFTCFDMLMSVFPVIFLTVITTLVGGVAAVAEGLLGGGTRALCSVGSTLGMLALTMLLMGLAVMLCVWRRIHMSSWRKLAAILTFPLYMLTFIPIAIAALLSRRVTWRHIAHGAAPSSVPRETDDFIGC